MFFTHGDVGKIHVWSKHKRQANTAIPTNYTYDTTHLYSIPPWKINDFFFWLHFCITHWCWIFFYVLLAEKLSNFKMKMPTHTLLVWMNWFSGLLELWGEVASWEESAWTESSHPQVSLAWWSASRSDLEGATGNMLLSQAPQCSKRGSHRFYKRVNTRDPSSSTHQTRLIYGRWNQDFIIQTPLTWGGAAQRTASCVTGWLYVLSLFLGWANAPLLVL